MLYWVLSVRLASTWPLQVVADQEIKVRVWETRSGLGTKRNATVFGPMRTVFRQAFICLGYGGVIFAVAAASAGAEDFDAGKSGARLFASNCATCHANANTIAKRASSHWFLTLYLREHYTASQASASELADYLTGLNRNAPRAKPKPKSTAQSPAGSGLQQQANGAGATHRTADPAGGSLRPPADIPRH